MSLPPYATSASLTLFTLRHLRADAPRHTTGVRRAMVYFLSFYFVILFDTPPPITAFE